MWSVDGEYWGADGDPNGDVMTWVCWWWLWLTRAMMWWPEDANGGSFDWLITISRIARACRRICQASKLKWLVTQKKFFVWFPPSIENMQKGDKLWNFKSKLPETRAFKGACYISTKPCTDRGNPTNKFNLWVTSHFKVGWHPLLALSRGR